MSHLPASQPRGSRVAEALLIVLSILMAFGIEASWSRRGEHLAEREALYGLRDDFTENVERLGSARVDHTKIRDASIRLLAMTGPDAQLEASDLTMDTLVMALIGGPKMFPVTTTYDALIGSGRLDLLENATLRRELARWATAIADLRDVEREGFTQMDQRLLPFLWDYVPIVTLDLNVLPDYAEVEELARSRFPTRYGDLLRSIRFENAVEERMNSSINTIERVTAAETAAQRVLSLVHTELQ